LNPAAQSTTNKSVFSSKKPSVKSKVSTIAQRRQIVEKELQESYDHRDALKIKDEEEAQHLIDIEKENINVPD
jgi:hypothetical protein